jgi:hypothetical protein
LFAVSVAHADGNDGSLGNFGSPAPQPLPVTPPSGRVAVVPPVDPATVPPLPLAPPFAVAPPDAPIVDAPPFALAPPAEVPPFPVLVAPPEANPPFAPPLIVVAPPVAVAPPDSVGGVLEPLLEHATRRTHADNAATDLTLAVAAKKTVRR